MKKNIYFYVFCVEILAIFLAIFFRFIHISEYTVYNSSPSFSSIPFLALFTVIASLIVGYNLNRTLVFPLLGSMNNIIEFLIFKNVVDYIPIFDVGTVNFNDALIYSSIIIFIYLIIKK